VGATCRHDRRQGLTLVEVLLVLGLLVVLASIAWPLLDRPLANRRLHVAADTLRTEWARARNQAIAKGQTVRFSYTLGERNYSVKCDSETALSSADGLASETNLFDTSDAFLGAEDADSGPKLPEGITFSEAEVYDELESSLGLAGSSRTDLGLSSSSTPIEFYPDGSTSTARVVLKNDYDRCIEVTLRGLTGVASIGEIYSVEGVLP
jgi:prepilin-type N-terminal cleavage/methylation domain-containing protein